VELADKLFWIYFADGFLCSDAMLSYSGTLVANLSQEEGMKTARVAIIAASLCMGGIGAGAAFSSDSVVDRGKDVFAAQKCALCHSIAGIGGMKMALDGIGAKLNAEDIRKWVRTPKQMKSTTMMKSYPNLPDKDLNDLTAFLLSLK
jgi:cytochrome c2